MNGNDNTPAAQEAVARPEPYIIGNQYRTQAGDLVRFVAVHSEGTSYECMEDESGVNRYTRRDFGRVTGTCHEYSDPRNTPPLYAAPVAAAPAVEALKRIRLRMHFIGMPGESMLDRGDGVWMPDWRYEAQLIEHVLHGRSITVAEKPTDTRKRIEVASTPAAPVGGWDAQAYAQMADELESWKQRALMAEGDFNRLHETLNAESGPTFMGEPVLSAPAAPGIDLRNSLLSLPRFTRGYRQFGDGSRCLSSYPSPDGDFVLWADVDRLLVLPDDKPKERTTKKNHDGPCWRQSHADCGC